jgi:GR25 family glycosyltransferase involved in LPS biosynthesis
MEGKIDIVYTWVDSNDKEWYNQKEYWYEKIKNGDNNKIRFPMTKNSSTEINISITSVLKYANWINNIFIVTMRPQIPNIPKDNRIKIIHHDEIWENKEELPVFNSHAIEANIHKIKNLSENFIYMCDDVFFCNNVYPNNFFSENNIIISGNIMPPNLKHNDPYICSHVNLYNITKKHYFNPSHFSIPLKKTLMNEAEKFYDKIWRETSKSKFRSTQDIPPIASTITYANINNKIEKSTLKYLFFKEIKEVKFTGIKSIKNVNCICINNSSQEDKIWENFLSFIKCKKNEKYVFPKINNNNKLYMHIYLINLEERKDRLEKMKVEFQKLNLNFEIFKAIKNNNGALGCTLSHIECLKMAKNNNFDYCMICEDDAEFYIYKKQIDFYVNEFIANKNFKVLNLICNVEKNNISKYNDIFNTSNKILTTTCYVVKKEYYDNLIYNFEYSRDNLIPLDVTWQELQKKDIFVFPNFNCGNQFKSYSDIQKKHVNYKLNMTSNNKKFSSIKELLKK